MKVKVVIAGIVLISILLVLRFDETITLYSKNNQYAKDTHEIVCVLWNGTMRTVEYGDWFNVQMKQNGEWIPANTVKINFDLGLKYLMPLSAAKLRIPVHYFLEDCKPGIYRIVKRISIDSSIQYVYFEFKVIG